MPPFKIHSPFTPKGDQPGAIDALVDGIRGGRAHQVMLGVTGSGKTYTVANVIEQVQKPTLVIAHNKTLAAQLYAEFCDFFPENAVAYFVSYYDYYQPEAYLPTTDTFIEKDSAINDAIDRMRHAATASLLQRNDIVIVASVSCIYGIGSPEAYHGMLLYLEEGATFTPAAVLKKLVQIQYTRNEMDFYRGTFRVRGDVLDIFPAASEDRCIRVEFFGDRIDALYEMDALRGTVIQRLPKVAIYPNSHHVIPPERMARALAGIEEEMHARIAAFRAQGKLLEAQRIEQRTVFDLSMIREIGYCQGVENYSRHLSGRAPGQPPPTLLDYFPKDYLLVIDESHATLPQIGAMQEGDRSRKTTLVDYGFRLPSALDNRPLKFTEFEAFMRQTIYVSATPGPYEMNRCAGRVIDLLVRPTGLLDPEVFVRPARGQVDDLLDELRQQVVKSERTLVTTLTKRMAEDLTEYYQTIGLKVRYLHSEIKTIERMDLLRDLRRGAFDILIGINLLREGLDLPEVSLVAILDADKEGFLRSYRSLIQTAGRAARHVSGRVILYAERVTDAMRQMIGETQRRRHLQATYNAQHGITPESVRKAIQKTLRPDAEGPATEGEDATGALDGEGGARLIRRLETQMREAARNLEFEKAACLRDRLKKIKEADLGLVESVGHM